MTTSTTSMTISKPSKPMSSAELQAVDKAVKDTTKKRSNPRKSKDLSKKNGIEKTDNKGLTKVEYGDRHFYVSFITKKDDDTLKEVKLPLKGYIVKNRKAFCITSVNPICNFVVCEIEVNGEPSTFAKAYPKGKDGTATNERNKLLLTGCEHITTDMALTALKKLDFTFIQQAVALHNSNGSKDFKVIDGNTVKPFELSIVTCIDRAMHKAHSIENKLNK